MAQQPGGKRAIERNERRATLVAWTIIACLVAVMLLWAFFSLRVIGDRPQTFHYRTAPLVPAETYSSSEPASTSTQAPKQVNLPPAVVGKRAK